ncbi:hypothetical protein GCM10020000_14700 [Streptomyces olivoverticillatus]
MCVSSDASRPPLTAVTPFCTGVDSRYGPEVPERARKPRIPWTTSLLAALAALMAALLAPPAAQAAAAGSKAPPESRPVYSYDRAVRETVWVDIKLDGDGDGRTDRVAADIIRPREAAERGRKVPVVMDASPYYSCCGRGNESQKKTYDAQGKPVQFPLYYDNYFVPRGYAVVLVDLAGTNRSDGCIDIGGRSDIQSAKAVIDWLNGRARGYSSRTGKHAVSAGWSTGAVGMIGKSYDGTVANGVAATGVKGLKTIVPIGAISSWYDYYFAKGAALYDGGPDGLANDIESPEAHGRCQAVQRKLVEGAPRNGDRTALWDERDYVKDAHKVRASVFAVHGMQDLNVRTKHFGQWWDALAANGVERKVWLSQTGHVDPFDYRRDTWVPTLHRWFDHYLLGYDNGIEREPMADVERAPRPVVHRPRLAAPRHRRDHRAPRRGPAARRRHPGHHARAARHHRRVHRRPHARRERLVGPHRPVHARQGRVHHRPAHPRPASGRFLEGQPHRHPLDRLGPPVGRPGRPGTGHDPQLRGLRRRHPHPRGPHLLGQRHHR